VLAVVAMTPSAFAADEKQITTSPKNHMLDNNDNFSSDGKFLCYDTREMYGGAIENSRSVEKVEIATGVETVLCEAKEFVTGAKAAPGIGACSFLPTENKIIFIHGPNLEEVPVRGYYGKPNRQGAIVVADGKSPVTYLDKRDVDTTRDTIPGAHRGGTHRHEFTLDGKRVGFTYDDFLLTKYERTIGYVEYNHPKSPKGALGYFALLVPVVPPDTAKPGDLVHAAADSWIGEHGLMRGFIGKIKEQDGSFQESLFVVDVPANTDITTADSGSATRFPKPPKGVTIRRLTHTAASGNVRGTVKGDRIAYIAKGDDGKNQVFIIASDGSDQDADPAKRPVQATHLSKGAGTLRWHPSGNSILCESNGGIVSTCVKPGPDFGKSVNLTPQGDKPERGQLVLSPDGKLMAYNKAIPTTTKDGKPVKTYNGSDPTQIFVLPFPDANGDGIAD
jgi:hypothetical protein